MSRTKRSDFSNNYYCKCSRANDGDKRLSKRKQEYLKKIRSGVQERIRQKPPKVAKEGTLLKKRVGAPVKHYVNLPGWVVRNLIDICKTKGQRKDKIKPKSSPQETRSMEESVRKEKQIQKNAENEQVPGEVMEIKREMATTLMGGFLLRATCTLILATLLVLAFKK